MRAAWFTGSWKSGALHHEIVDEICVVVSGSSKEPRLMCAGCLRWQPMKYRRVLLPTMISYNTQLSCRTIRIKRVCLRRQIQDVALRKMQPSNFVVYRMRCCQLPAGLRWTGRWCIFVSERSSFCQSVSRVADVFSTRPPGGHGTN